jgi:predicted O-methyltransferase YrrM
MPIPKENYHELPMSQKKGVCKTFGRFFVVEMFDKIVELGTGNGTFTWFLADQAKKYGTELHSFDIIEAKISVVREEIVAAGGNLYVTDVLSKPHPTVIELLKDGRVLLLCDNGNKIKEWHLYSSYLKEQDVIMAHDYFSGKKGTDAAKKHSKNVWRSIEITNRDIQKVNDRYNIQPFWAKEFSSVAWGSRIKCT